MKTPDPDHPMKYSPPGDSVAENAHNPEAPSALDPLDALLAEDLAASNLDASNDVDESEDERLFAQDESAYLEPDDERLYTNEFIRANENASRSLFLGFLGLALLATALVAWVSLSSSNPEEPSENLPTSVQELPPVSVPSAPPSEIPDQRLDSIPLSPVEPGLDGSLNESTQPPLSFPAQPTQPPLQEGQSVSPPTSENAPEPAITEIPPLPEGSVPPPPPVNP